MTELQKFAFIYLPVGITIAAWISVFVFNYFHPPANKKKKPH